MEPSAEQQTAAHTWPAWMADNAHHFNYVVYVSFAPFLLYMVVGHLADNGCLTVWWEFYSLALHVFSFVIVTVTAWSLLSTNLSHLGVPAVFCMVIVWDCISILREYGIGKILASIRGKQSAEAAEPAAMLVDVVTDDAAEPVAAAAVEQAAAAGGGTPAKPEQEFRGDDIYSDLTRPFWHCCLCFMLQTVLVKFYVVGLAAPAYKFATRVEYTAEDKDFIVAAIFAQLCLYLVLQNQAPNFWMLYGLLGTTVVSSGGNERRLERIEIQMRMAMSGLVNMVYAKFVMVSFGVLLAFTLDEDENGHESRNYMDFVKDCFAVVFITQIDDIAGSPFTASVVALASLGQTPDATSDRCEPAAEVRLPVADHNDVPPSVMPPEQAVEQDMKRKSASHESLPRAAQDYAKMSKSCCEPSQSRISMADDDDAISSVIPPELDVEQNLKGKSAAYSSLTSAEEESVDKSKLAASPK
eukprot:TRINITY_DN6940_c0_g1_i1.p1 TRINITY_DN6940_c0_g1~~TRINITY_DN6940_c0_g1_i1.p1  ORF type:complete len:483 (-),score=78.68 TRINITY_DN6940_c0_g1_i1:244-1650(-)